MTWEKVFLVHDGLRPIWRCCLSAAMIVVAYMGVAIALGTLFGALDWEATLLSNLFWLNLLMLPALLGVFKILTAVFEGKSLGSVGLAFRGRWRQELAVGLGLGTAMILLVAGLERLLGLATFRWTTDSPQRLLSSGAFCFLLFLIAATNEELAFRGYPFQRLVDSIGSLGAVAVFSALFGLSHLANPSHTLGSTLNTMLVGVPLSVGYLRTRALWLPVGLHFGWNFFQGCALGLPVSGLLAPFSIFRAEVRGSNLLTGGNYGPEGGLLATAVIAAATLYLCFSRRIYISEEMRELVFGRATFREATAAVETSPPASADAAKDGRN